MQDNFTLPNIAQKYGNLIVMVHYNIFEKTITLFKGKIGKYKWCDYTASTIKIRVYKYFKYF